MEGVFGRGWLCAVHITWTRCCQQYWAGHLWTEVGCVSTQIGAGDTLLGSMKVLFSIAEAVCITCWLSPGAIASVPAAAPRAGASMASTVQAAGSQRPANHCTPDDRK